MLITAPDHVTIVTEMLRHSWLTRVIERTTLSIVYWRDSCFVSISFNSFMCWFRIGAHFLPNQFVWLVLLSSCFCLSGFCFFFSFFLSFFLFFFFNVYELNGSLLLLDLLNILMVSVETGALWFRGRWPLTRLSWDKDDAQASAPKSWLYSRSFYWSPTSRYCGTRCLWSWPTSSALS